MIGDQDEDQFDNCSDDDKLPFFGLKFKISSIRNDFNPLGVNC